MVSLRCNQKGSGVQPRGNPAVGIFLGDWFKSGFAVMGIRDFGAYFDESGTKADTVAVVVAGFIAPTEQWIAVERDWKHILSMFSVSSLHMRHFAHSAGEYAAWKGDENRRRDFLSRLIGTIKIRAHHSFACAVLMDGYRKVDSKYKLHEVISPYTVAARTCVGKVCEWGKKWSVDENHIAFFFEDGSEDKTDLMRRMKRDGKRAPIFLKKDQSVVFQAADMLAYEHLLGNRHFLAGKISAYEDLRHPLKALNDIPNGGPEAADWGVFHEANLENACIELDLPARDSDVEVVWPEGF
jgi:hypothetical protein